MPRCTGTKRNGKPCTVFVDPPKTYCWWHDPQHSGARRQAASKGGRRAGRGRGSDLPALRAEIHALISAVKDGSLDRGRGSVAIQGYNCLLKCTEVEMKVREQYELMERLEALERRYGSGGRSWGS